MSIHKNESRFVLTALASIIISACSGDNGTISIGGSTDTAGIGGSGFISSGSVTGFGSVFVNGVKFETDSAIFDVEDNINSTQADLRVGMVVQVAGTINSDGVTGTATAIQYSDDIEGPVGSAPVENTDATEKTFTILGKTIVISIADTAYEGVTYETIDQGNVLEVSGFYDENGALRASYLEIKSSTFDASSEVEVKGVISNLSGTGFVIQNINVDASAANLSDLENGLQNDVLVEVKGTYDSASNTILANEVEAEENSLSEDADEVELEGYITRFVSNNDFDINGFKVDASNATFTPPTLQLSLGDKVEAEGTISNGVLIALEVEIRGGNAELSATVDSVNVQSNSFTMAIVSGQPSVTVQLTTATRMEDDVEGSDDNFLLSELAVNDFVDVLGFESGASTVTATRIKREAEIKDVELQGVVTGKNNGVSVDVLGVKFLVDVDTEYEAANETVLSSTAFFNGITLDETVISIEDKITEGGNIEGTANSIKIEN